MILNVKLRKYSVSVPVEIDVYIEPDESSTGYRGSISVERISMDKSDVEELLLELIGDELQRKLYDLWRLNALEDVKEVVL